LTAPSQDESALVARSQAGDLSAFNELVETYQGQVYNLCLRMLRSPHSAEDATQEAFISAYRHIRSFRGGVFRAWLLRIAANACADELRRRRRRPQISLEEASDDQERPLDLPDPGETPEDFALRRELNRTIEAGLITLPPDQRLAVVLCDVHGLSYEEIAESMRVSVGTVKSRISRGRERMRRYLAAHRELLPDTIRHIE
jgi:RNA polymerase sigma-70 factor (ECF subfamily)